MVIVKKKKKKKNALGRHRCAHEVMLLQPGRCRAKWAQTDCARPVQAIP
jgi:hypothetical protein